MAVVAELKKFIKESALEKELVVADFSWVINGLVDRGKDGSGGLSDMKNGLNQILQSDGTFKDKIAAVKALENQFGGRFLVRVGGPGGEKQMLPASQILSGAFQRSEADFRAIKEPIVEAEMGKVVSSAGEYLRIKQELAG